jgi:hypothetical protein
LERQAPEKIPSKARKVFIQSSEIRQLEKLRTFSGICAVTSLEQPTKTNLQYQ